MYVGPTNRRRNLKYNYFIINKINKMVTQEDLFLYNIQQIISNILKDYQREIQGP